LTLRSKLFAYGLFGGLAGLCFSVVAILAVVGASGLSAMPGVLVLLVHLAYLPSRLSGRLPENYFQPELVWPVFVNTFGWTMIAILIGLLQHVLREAKTRSA
jgi:uncharacterized membrane protein